MTALAKEKMRLLERWTYRTFTLTSGTKAYKGGICMLAAGTGKVVPGTEAGNHWTIGTFAETVDATAADKPVNVTFGKEVEIEWFANSGSNAAVGTDLGAMAYVEDDQTVGVSAAGRSIAGRIWAVDATKGVAVERLTSLANTLDGLEARPGPTLAFVAADIVIGDNPKSGTVYDVPTSAANSTISLPATAVEGTVVWFKADGTKNGHTVQYRDVTTAITTALTASKRHLVQCVFSGSKWFANAYVSP